MPAHAYPMYGGFPAGAAMPLGFPHGPVPASPVDAAVANGAFLPGMSGPSMVVPTYSPMPSATAAAPVAPVAKPDATSKLLRLKAQIKK